MYKQIFQLWNDRLPKITLLGQPSKSNQKAGHPWITWKDVIRKNLRESGASWERVKKEVLNRLLVLLFVSYFSLRERLACFPSSLQAKESVGYVHHTTWCCCQLLVVVALSSYCYRAVITNTVRKMRLLSLLLIILKLSAAIRISGGSRGTGVLSWCSGGFVVGITCSGSGWDESFFFVFGF